MHLRLTVEHETWSFECPMHEIGEREQALLHVLLRKKNSDLDERFQSRLTYFLPHLLRDALVGSVAAPSKEQLELAREMSQFLVITIPDLALAYRDFMSTFISEHLVAYSLGRAVADNLVDPT
jgi:hypothetical protein